MFFPKKAAALAAGFIAALSVVTVAQNTNPAARPPRRWSSTTPRSTGSRSPTSRRSAKG